MTPKYPYRGRTAPLTSKVFILYIYSTNIGTEFLNMVYTLLFFSSKCSLFRNYNVFCSCIIHFLYTGCAKIKKYNSGTKRLKYTGMCVLRLWCGCIYWVLIGLCLFVALFGSRQLTSVSVGE